MIYFRHLEREWTYDDSRRELIVAGKRIRLCTERKPREGARPIHRLGESEWQVAACTFQLGYFLKLPDTEFLTLLGAPQSVNVAFSILS